MRSQSPLIIKHFIPLQFSKNVLDFRNIRSRSYIQPEQNPLQNIKLRGSKNQKDTNFTLVYKNKSNKQFTSKFKMKPNRLLKQLEQQSKKTSIIKNHILNQQLKMCNKVKPASKNRPSTVTENMPKSCRSVLRQEEGRIEREKDIVPRKIFSSGSFRKFTTVQTAKPYCNGQNNYNFSPYHKTFQHQLKIRGHKNPLNFF